MINVLCPALQLHAIACQVSLALLLSIAACLLALTILLNKLGNHYYFRYRKHNLTTDTILVPMQLLYLLLNRNLYHVRITIDI